MSEHFTPIAQSMPPQDAPIEWISPSGRIVRGKWCGGAVWLPEGCATYGYYTPAFWRPAPPPEGGKP